MNTASQASTKPDLAPRIALGLVIVLALLLLAQLAFDRDGSPVNRVGGAGFDFRFFYDAGQALSRGANPYAADWLVTPPLSALYGRLYAGLPFPTALRIHQLVLLSGVLLGFSLIWSRIPWASGIQGGGERAWTAGLVVLLVSYPVYMLVERGNLDGLVMGFLAAGIALALPDRPRSDVLAGLCLALAIHIKLYPLLIFLPLLIARRWRLLGILALLTVLIGALTPALWLSFLDNLLMRSVAFRLLENISIVSLFATLWVLVAGISGAPLFADMVGLMQLALVSSMALAYLPLLAGAALLDFRRTRASPRFDLLALLYLPFMIAVPMMSYPYGLVNLLSLIALLAWLWPSATPRQGRALLLIALGVGLAQSQVVLLLRVTGNPLVEALPGLGLLLIMIGGLAYRAAGGTLPER